MASAPVNSVPTSNRYFIARELGEPLKMRKQKTAIRAGALIDDARKWKAIGSIASLLMNCAALLRKKFKESEKSSGHCI